MQEVVKEMKLNEDTKKFFALFERMEHDFCKSLLSSARVLTLVHNI